MVYIICIVANLFFTLMMNLDISPYAGDVLPMIIMTAVIGVIAVGIGMLCCGLCIKGITKFEMQYQQIEGFVF